MSRSQLGKYRKLLTLIAGFLLVVFLVPLANPQDKTEQSPDEKARQKMLEREAADTLRHLKSSMEKDGFYSARIALNMWRSTAMDAGTFDQAQYDKFKKQLYEKSVRDCMHCFEEFLLEEDFYNANFCLQTWRMHSRELGTYDQAEYEALKKKLAEAKTAKASRKAGKIINNIAGTVSDQDKGYILTATSKAGELELKRLRVILYNLQMLSRFQRKKSFLYFTHPEFTNGGIIHFAMILAIMDYINLCHFL